MNLLRLAFLLVIFALPLQAKAQEASELEGMPSGLYELDKNHASMIWKVSHLGLSNYTARFTSFDIDIDFNALDPAASRVRATIDPTSVETDFPEPEKKDFDKELAMKESWFNAEQFPQISFMSTSVEKTGDNTGKVTGDLTFLGVTKPVTLDVVFNKAIGNHPFANKPALGFSATTTIKRSDFGLTTYIPQIGDEVEVIIEAEFFYAG
jgi:polyisoprenoid-binding protein YceI